MMLDRDVILRLLPGYDLGPELGRGASGIVYSGTHRHLGRAVAIKQLPRAFGADPETKHRFVTEARLLATLEHPHIVPVYDYAEDAGLCVLVLEQLSGGSLWDRMCSAPPDAPTSCATMLAICAGLHHAHQQGILHRDIKPDNMLFASSGRPKLADFGIAKVLDDHSAHATRAGDVLGTPAYMAPEQAQARPLGPATDLYAIGVVLYELLAGALPFGDDGDSWAVLYRHVHEPPPDLRQRAPHVPDGIARVVMSTLAKDPAQRPASVETFARDLAAASTTAWGAQWLEQTGIPVELSATVTQAMRPVSRPTVVVSSPIVNDIPSAAPSSRLTFSPIGRPESMAMRLATLAHRLDMPVAAEIIERFVLRREPEATVAIVGEPLAGTSTLVGGLSTRAGDENVLTNRPAVLIELSSCRSAAAMVGAGHSALDGLIIVTWAGRQPSATVTELRRTATNAAVATVVVAAHHDLVARADQQQDAASRRNTIDIGAIGWHQGQAVLDPVALDDILGLLDAGALRSARRRDDRHDLAWLAAIATGMDRALHGVPGGSIDRATLSRSAASSAESAALVDDLALRLTAVWGDGPRSVRATGLSQPDLVERARREGASTALIAFEHNERALTAVIDRARQDWGAGRTNVRRTPGGSESSSMLVPLRAGAVSRFHRSLDDTLALLAAEVREAMVLAPANEVTLQQLLRRPDKRDEGPVEALARSAAARFATWLGVAIDDAFSATRAALADDLDVLCRPLTPPVGAPMELVEEFGAVRDAIAASQESFA